MTYPSNVLEEPIIKRWLMKQNKETRDVAGDLLKLAFSIGRIDGMKNIQYQLEQNRDAQR